MADPDPSPELKGPTVAASANQCLESFQQCLISASSVHPREVSMVEDQLARFSSWASSIGVFAQGSASMDHRLRYASEVQSVVTGLLESLNYRVQTCSKTLAQLAESSSTDASTTAKDRLAQSFLDIAAEISRLNKISNTIRRASKETQVLKASNFQIKDDDGENVEPLLLSHFEHHIGDWFPGISETIRQRLARAMLLRRKRILYRRHRQGNTSIRSDNTISQASVTLPDAQAGAMSQVQSPSKQKGENSTIAKPAAKVAPSQVKSVTTLAPEKFKMVSSTPSIVSATRTIASGKHQVLTYPPAPGFVAKRRYEKLKRQRIVEAAETSTELGLLELLESDLQAIGEITCPYCLYALPAAEVFDERKWQNHVKNDLDPYVCLFENCDQPDVLYTHSDEWLGHLHQHGKVWRCSSHREMGPFSTLEHYMRHMREVHDTKLSDKQLRVVANRNSRKATKLFQSCPLCGREEAEVDGRLEDHLAGHLRSLALKSLPSYQDEIPDDVADENNSVDGSRPRSRSTLREMEEEKEMLQEEAGSFWDHWTPQLTQSISVNFFGDVYFELDLGDSEARVASLFFDTMVFKESSENLGDDPILQSMLQQQLARIEVIDADTDDSSDLSAQQEAAGSSKAPVGETSGQDEADRTVSQQPVGSEAAGSRAAAPEQDTEIDSPGGDEAPEILVEQKTQASPPTKLDITADAETTSLSNVPTDETSRRDEVDNTAAQGSVNVETVDAQTATVEKDVEDPLSEGSKGSEPTRPEPEPNFLALIEEADLSDDTNKEAYRLLKRERGSTQHLSELRSYQDKLMQRLFKAVSIDRELNASIQRLKSVDKGNVVEGGNVEDHEYFNLDDAFYEKLMDRCVEKPEVYQEFLKIIRAHEREQTPMRDVYAQIRALADTSPDLSEDEKPVLPESASEGKRDAQPKKQDARPKPGVEHHRPPSLLSTGAATPSQQSQTQDTLCRNVLIYGHCRYEAEGCAFNHDPNRNAGPPLPPPPPPSSQLRQESRVADPSTTTGTYAVTQDPGSYMPNSRDVTRSHRSSSLDSASRPPVIVMSTQKDRPAGTTSQSSNVRSSSPIRHKYRPSKGQFYTQPASSIYSRDITHSYANQAGPDSPYGRAPSGGASAMPSLLTTNTDSLQSQHMEASRASSEISVEAAKAERDYYLQNPYQPASQRRTSSPEGGHRYPPIPEIQTPRPPGASSKASTSLEKDDPPYRKKRASGVYINGQKVLDPDRRDRPLTKGQSPSSSSGKASGGRSYSKQPAGPSMTFDNQASAASTPQAWYTGVPRDSKAHQHDLGSASVPTAIHRQTSDNYYPHPPAERDSFEPQLPPLPPLLPPPRYIYPDDAFEADVEDDIPPPKNPRRKIRPAIYVNGEKVMGLKRENSPVGSLRERIVNVDNPKEQEAAEPVERYKQAELERIATEKAEKDFEEYEKRLRADRAKGERVRSRSPPQLSTTSLTTSNAPPYDTIGPRPVIVEDRPRVEIEIVDGSRSRRPRHASHDPRSVYSFSWDDDDEEQLLERRRERRRQREAEERFGEDQLTIRISDPNADTSGRRPSPYRRPSVQILDPEAKKEGKEKGPSVVDFDSEAELRRAVQRLNAKQEYFRRETAARRLSRKEEGKGKEEEGEQNQPALKDHSIELREATRRLNAMEARREERARKEETEEDEIQRRRLVERMEPRRRDAMSSRRSRVLYDDGVYRWE